MMATGGSLNSDQTCKSAVRKWVENGVEVVKRFTYQFPFDWHFRYRHAMGDHNNLRHALPSIEDTWTLDHNQQMGVPRLCLHPHRLRGQCVPHRPILLPPVGRYAQTRRVPSQACVAVYLQPLARAGGRDQEARFADEPVHQLMKAPAHASEYRNRRWKIDAMSKYQQHYRRSIGCKKRVRTYCSCDPGHWMCTPCHVKHCIIVHTEPFSE